MLMVSSPQIVGMLIGLFIGSIIFWLVRRDHMMSKDGIGWLLVAGGIVLYGSFPGLNDKLGVFLGIGYPPIIPVLLGIGAVLIKLLINDTERVKTRVDVERLVQRIAILEAELEQEKMISNNRNVRVLKQLQPQPGSLLPDSAKTKAKKGRSPTSEKIEPVISESLIFDLSTVEPLIIEPLKRVADHPDIKVKGKAKAETKMGGKR
jgi:hypothetical protein